MKFFAQDLQLSKFIHLNSYGHFAFIYFKLHVSQEKRVFMLLKPRITVNSYIYFTCITSLSPIIDVGGSGFLATGWGSITGGLTGRIANFGKFIPNE